jgi:hypothetical protein
LNLCGDGDPRFWCDGHGLHAVYFVQLGLQTLDACDVAAREREGYVRTVVWCWRSARCSGVAGCWGGGPGSLLMLRRRPCVVWATRLPQYCIVVVVVAQLSWKVEFFIFVGESCVCPSHSSHRIFSLDLMRGRVSF